MIPLQYRNTVLCNKAEVFLMQCAVTVQSLNCAREVLAYKQVHFPSKKFLKKCVCILFAEF